MKHHYKLLCATLLSALCLAGPAMAAKPAVIDQSGLNGVQDYLDAKLPAPMKAAMSERGLAVWTAVSGVRLLGNGYCVALVGVTAASPDGRMARVPQNRMSSVVRYDAPNEAWARDDCRAEALRDAIATLAKSTLPAPGEMTSMLPTGGKRTKEKANGDFVNLTSYNTGKDGEDGAFDALIAQQLNTAVDYRHVTSVLYNTSFTMNSGDRLCFALYGLSARPPADRNARIPANLTAGLHVGGSAASCERGATGSAISVHFSEPWTGKGIFAGFEKTREDGVPLPDVAAIANKHEAALARASRSAPATARNVVRCSNVCTNGSCLRTFENGRTERWQAPRIRDPFSNNWTWDINTNACGQ